MSQVLVLGELIRMCWRIDVPTLSLAPCTLEVFKGRPSVCCLKPTAAGRALFCKFCTEVACFSCPQGPSPSTNTMRTLGFYIGKY